MNLNDLAPLTGNQTSTGVHFTQPDSTTSTGQWLILVVESGYILHFAEKAK